MSKRTPKRAAPAPVTAKPVKPPPPRFTEIEGALQQGDLVDLLYPHSAYHISVFWSYLEHQLMREAEVGLDLNPEFQRGHVWTRAQQIAYVEHILCGGESGRRILVAHVGRHQSDYKHRDDGSIYLESYALVDGKQRLEAVRAFMREEYRVFAGLKGRAEGWLYSELGYSMRRETTLIFDWDLIVVKTKADLLKLYLRFNAGGTPHAKEEIDRVRGLLAAETGTETPIL